MLAWGWGLFPHPKEISGISVSSIYSGFFNSKINSNLGSNEYNLTLFREAKAKIDSIARFVNTKVDEGVFPDHCSIAGLEEYDENDNEWYDWYDEDGNDFDDHFRDWFLKGKD